MTLVLEGSYSGNFGSLRIHANFLVDETNVHVMNGNVVEDFALAKRGGRPLAFVRNQAQDITLTNQPTGQTTWGFTESHYGNHDGEWIVLTRETTTGTIGKVRVHSHDGSELMLEFDIPAVVAGVNTSSTAMRAPKSISEFYGYYIVRIVRGDTGPMRFLVFDEDGVVQPNLTITLEAGSPTALRGAATETDSPLYVLSRGSPLGTAIPYNPGTGTEVPNEDLSEASIANADGISIYRHHLYAATTTSIVEYTGVPVLGNPWPDQMATGGGGFNFGLLNVIIAQARMRRDLSREDQR